MAKPDTRKNWLDNPHNGVRILWALLGMCAVLLAIDWFVPKHGPFAVEHWLGFYGILGFVACIGFVFAAKLMRHLLMRPEDYYDE
jgi:hypothetical protein